MNESHSNDMEQGDDYHVNHPSDMPAPTSDSEMLQIQIQQAFQHRAEQVRFTPAMRVEIMQSLQARKSRASHNRRILGIAVSTCAALALLLAILFTSGLINPNKTSTQVASLSFVTESVLETPAELAHGGQPVSLDPTARYLVYGVANQSGAMYVTNLADPVARNELAMRYARDVAWAPDGSALVTTIYPVDTNVPLLALVPTGQYMRLLGEPALAAAWLPSSTSTITYLTESNGQATLWKIMSDGKNAQPIGSMAMPVLVQRLNWSPNSRFLTLSATPGKNPDRALLQGPSHALYLFDTRTKVIDTLVAPGSDTLSSIAWSPNGAMLTYERIDKQHRVSLHTVDVTAHKEVFRILLQHELMGMSWSPDSNRLVYSDGGSIQAHVLRGQTLNFSSVHTMAAYPFWLDTHHILFLSIQNGVGQLIRLMEKRTT